MICGSCNTSNRLLLVLQYLGEQEIPRPHETLLWIESSLFFQCKKLRAKVLYEVEVHINIQYKWATTALWYSSKTLNTVAFVPKSKRTLYGGILKKLKFEIQRVKRKKELWSSFLCKNVKFDLCAKHALVCWTKNWCLFWIALIDPHVSLLEHGSQWHWYSPIHFVKPSVTHRCKFQSGIRVNVSVQNDSSITKCMTTL